jgi:hypothetical protein
MRTTFYTCVLFLFAGALFPNNALSGDWNHMAVNPQAVIAPDSLDLPLANKTLGLTRPFFQTIHFDLSIGFAFCDFSELQSLIGKNSGITLPLSFLVDIPFPDLYKDGPFSLISGFDFALGGGGGGGLFTFSTFLLYRPETFSVLRPIVGVGAARTWYNGTGEDDAGSVEIKAEETYPVLFIGLNLTPNTINALLTIPLVKKLQTTFETKPYTIQPAGIRFSLLVSL